MTTNSTVPLIPAVEYVRMSTDSQKLSIPFQQRTIRQYAEEHGMEVIRTYADEGKSGLKLKGREALIRLLMEVQEGRADFKVILVYDVSRWGRFQDIDESGYYEYLCRMNNIRVEYCGESFRNDIDPLSAIIKSIKRTMAAEYSREHSARVLRSIIEVAHKGFFTGGNPPYGYRRMIVTLDRIPKGILNVGERRFIKNDRMVLVPGPIGEVATVQRIFRLFVNNRMSPGAISQLLNLEGRPNRLGHPWRWENIRILLRNEVYIGMTVWCRHTRHLKSLRRRNPESQWIRVPNTHESIVSPELFNAAQRIIRSRVHIFHTRAELIGRMQYLLQKHGRLSTKVIREDARPDYKAYYKVFGGMREAYKAIDYVPKRDRHVVGRELHCRQMTKFLHAHIRDAANKAGFTIKNLGFGMVAINEKLSFAIRAAAYVPTPIGRLPAWRVLLARKYKIPDVTIIIRMAKNNLHAQDFFLFPRTMSANRLIRIGGRMPEIPESYRYSSREKLIKEMLTRADA